MRLPYNIEHHPCATGYLGYDAQGYAWRIQKTPFYNGAWSATSKHYPNRMIFTERLKDMGTKLKEFNQLKTA